MITTGIERLIVDQELGEVRFRRSSRAKHYHIRVKDTKTEVVIPRQGNYETALEFLYSKKEELIWIIKEQWIMKESLPERPVYDEADLRQKAYAYLPGRLLYLAREHGFLYTSLKIQKSKSRWGSCSSKGNINLSLYLMTLPAHLIDYVILHELCHTVHMNHSPAFWDLLDRHTGNRAKDLRRELRQGYSNNY